MKGNVLELAVAVIIAGAFGTIVTSLTGDVIMPVVGFVFGGAARQMGHPAAIGSFCGTQKLIS